MLYHRTEGPTQHGSSTIVIDIGPELMECNIQWYTETGDVRGLLFDAYANDIAAVIVAHDRAMAQTLLGRVVRTESKWIEDHGIQLAREKTEIVIVLRRQIPINPQIGVTNNQNKEKQAVRYLGVMINKKLLYWEHVK